MKLFLTSLMAGTVHAAFLGSRQEQLSPGSGLSSYSMECGINSYIRVTPEKLALLQEDNVPGAGIDKIYNRSAFAPFKKVEKDGFANVACVKDYMYYHGDKYGNNKGYYELANSARVSIVHYDTFVASKDRVKMTPKVCFEFCRTVPSMGFFGILNGHKCYCTPYFEAMASDSSQCDVACDGDKQPGCGGETKSTIYSMRKCDDTLSNLGEWETKSHDMAFNIDANAGTLQHYIDEMERFSKEIMPMFGAVGDSVAAGLARRAEGYNVESAKFARGARALQDKLNFLSNELHAHAEEIVTRNALHDAKMVTRAESLVKEAQETYAKGEPVLKKLEDMLLDIKPKMMFRPPQIQAANAYMPVMYFIDKKMDGINHIHRNVQKKGNEVGVPTTCNGDLIGAPVVGLNREDCAQACDQALVHGCKGFMHFDNGGYSPTDHHSMCFLFSSFHEGHYYTGCVDAAGNGIGDGLETNARTGCWAKYSKFAGGKFDGSGTLKPDPKGQCKECFKTFTKHARCYTDVLQDPNFFEKHLGNDYWHRQQSTALQ